MVSASFLSKKFPEMSGQTISFAHISRTSKRVVLANLHALAPYLANPSTTPPIFDRPFKGENSLSKREKGRKESLIRSGNKG